jgi:hypothetical protein
MTDMPIASESPRSARLMQWVLWRLNLRALPPFSVNAGVAAFAVAGGLLLPDLLGGLAGHLLAMQGWVMTATGVLLCMLIVRSSMREQADSQSIQRGQRAWAAMIDCLMGFFFLFSLLIGGLFGPLEFVVLFGATFIGAVSGARGARWIAAVLARFVVALPVLVIACWLGGLPGEFEKWPGARGSIAVAGAYFGTLAYAEWSGTYLRFQEWLLKNAATMKFRRGRP